MDTTNKVPVHVAIIMDGNGRWAKKQGLARILGHQKGVRTIQEIVRAAQDWNVKYLTLYAFSRENWARPKREVDFLMNLLSEYLDSEFEELKRNSVRFNVIGRIEELPPNIQKKIIRNVKEMEQGKGLTLTLALNYSSRVEITDAARRLCEKVSSGALKPEEISESHVEGELYTVGMPDPDLLIRTSGELRISNFLLWQISYTEIYVSEKYWPEFTKEDFSEALRAYQKRERRFGRSDTIRSLNNAH
jgi:undecaprenyl diphosphate synthase